jgi:hypothetical protein
MRVGIFTTQGKAFRKTISFVVLFFFSLLNVFPSTSYAQAVLNLPSVGAKVLSSKAFSPALLTGIKVNIEQPMVLDFIIRKGEGDLADASLENISRRLVKYFLIALTLPEKDIWVNLSPYEKDRITTKDFGRTEMGRDLLEQDYILKQFTATLTDPANALGKEFWDRVYASAREKFGDTEIPMDAFNKVWIMPGKAVIYEKDSGAYIIENRLKVLSEQDYLSLEANKVGNVDAVPEEARQLNAASSDVVRDVLIPEITREVNEGKNFAPLRQIYNSLLLAAWYKVKVRNSILNKAFADKGKIAGNEVEDKAVKEKIYAQYLEAFKKGVYNYIKEDVDTYSQELVPRKYFSGGAGSDYVLNLDAATNGEKSDIEVVGVFTRSALPAASGMFVATVRLTPPAENPVPVILGGNLDNAMTVTNIQQAIVALHASSGDVIEKGFAYIAHLQKSLSEEDIPDVVRELDTLEARIVHPGLAARTRLSSDVIRGIRRVFAQRLIDYESDRFREQPRDEHQLGLEAEAKVLDELQSMGIPDLDASNVFVLEPEISFKIIKNLGRYYIQRSYWESLPRNSIENSDIRTRRMIEASGADTFTGLQNAYRYAKRYYADEKYGDAIKAWWSPEVPPSLLDQINSWSGAHPVGDVVVLDHQEDQPLFTSYQDVDGTVYIDRRLWERAVEQRIGREVLPYFIVYAVAREDKERSIYEFAKSYRPRDEYKLRATGEMAGEFARYLKEVFHLEAVAKQIPEKLASLENFIQPASVGQDVTADYRQDMEVAKKFLKDNGIDEIGEVVVKQVPAAEVPGGFALKRDKTGSGGIIYLADTGFSLPDTQFLTRLAIELLAVDSEEGMRWAYAYIKDQITGEAQVEIERVQKIFAGVIESFIVHENDNEGIFAERLKKGIAPLGQYPFLRIEGLGKAKATTKGLIERANTLFFLVAKNILNKKQKPGGPEFKSIEEIEKYVGDLRMVLVASKVAPMTTAHILLNVLQAYALSDADTVALNVTVQDLFRKFFVHLSYPARKKLALDIMGLFPGIGHVLPDGDLMNLYNGEEVLAKLLSMLPKGIAKRVFIYTIGTDHYKALIGKGFVQGFEIEGSPEERAKRLEHVLGFLTITGELGWREYKDIIKKAGDSFITGGEKSGSRRLFWNAVNSSRTFNDFKRLYLNTPQGQVPEKLWLPAFDTIGKLAVVQAGFPEMEIVVFHIKRGGEQVVLDPNRDRLVVDKHIKVVDVPGLAVPVAASDTREAMKLMLLTAGEEEGPIIRADMLTGAVSPLLQGLISDPQMVKLIMLQDGKVTLNMGVQSLLDRFYDPAKRSWDVSTMMEMFPSYGIDANSVELKLGEWKFTSTGKLETEPSVLWITDPEGNRRGIAYRVVSEYDEEIKDVRSYLDLLKELNLDGEEEPIPEVTKSVMIKFLSEYNKADSAMGSKEKKQVQGGIDFDLDPADMEIRSEGPGIEFNLDPAMLEQGNFDGLVPVILNITPVTDLPVFLGARVEDLEPAGVGA